MGVSEIYLLLAVLGFIVLAACVIFLVIAVVKTFNSITQLFVSLQKQVENLDAEPRKLIGQANELSESLNYKMKCLDPLFHSVSNIGECVDRRTAKYKNEKLLDYLFERLEEKDESKLDQVLDAATLALNALELFQKFKKRR